MKRSVLMPNTYQITTQKPENFDIPKCQSQNQFFKLGNTRRKKRNNVLACSMTINPFCTGKQSTNFDARFSAFSQKGLMINDALTSVTDSSSNADNGICFKNKHIKQKVNKVQTSSNIFELGSDLWKKPASRSPKAPVIHLPLMKQPIKKSRKFTINDFHLLRKIGQGTYSTVYLAIQKQTNFICSIKSLSKKFIKSQKLIHTVLRELKIHHYLRHRHIVNIYGQFDDEEHLYLICQYCTDIDLHRYLKEKQRDNLQIDVVEVSEFVKQLCQAVAVMHKDYLMHRDIKPQNVFLTMGKFVKLGDFGWSVYFGDHGLRNTQCGTPLYLAPQLVQQHEYSQTVDIWAIGVLTYELLTGQIPFKIRAAKDLHKILDQNIKFQYIQNDLARDFVQKLLVRDAKLRMQIEDVLQHPFLNMQEND